MSALARLIDSLVEQFSPKRAVVRRYYRDRLSQTKKREQYAAAKAHRLSGPWRAVSGGVNDLIGHSSPAIRARVRQLIRDFPYFSRAINCTVDFVVGPGIVFQSRVQGNDGKLNKNIIQKIESAWKWWMDEADVSGKLHFYELMQLEKRQDVESGEFLIVKTLERDSRRFLPLAIGAYEADWLSGLHDSYGAEGIGITASSGDKEVRQGIEYERRTGRVTGYWFQDPTHGGRDIFVPADQVIHGFKTLRPQQLRGVSPFAPAVVVADDLDNYMGAEMDAAKLAAKYLAFIRTPDPAGMQSGRTTLTEDIDGDSKPLEDMENAIIEYLRPGEEVDIAKHERPGATFGPFVRLILTMISIGTDVPYELLTGDYQGLNFSTARIVRNDWSQSLRPIAVRHVRQFCMPIFRSFLDWSVLSGKLDLPGYWKDPRMYWESEWQPPGMTAIDPLRESKSQIEAISGGLKSPQEVARERGRDLEDVYREIKAAKDLADEYGLDFSKPSTALKNNPAAIQGEE